MKRCPHCKQNLRNSAFCKDASHRSGLTSWCKLCQARKTPSAKRLSSNAARQRRYEKRYPERQAARQALSAAIDSGAVKRLPCEICGNPDTHGHHGDYSQPLKVRWLCQPHHVEVHQGKLPHYGR